MQNNNNNKHVFALNSDWLIVLFTPFAIGQCKYFGFASRNRKPLYESIVHVVRSTDYDESYQTSIVDFGSLQGLISVLVAGITARIV